MKITITPNEQLREVLKYIDEHSTVGRYVIKINDLHCEERLLKEWEYYLIERGCDARQINLIYTQFIPLLKGLFTHGTQKIEVGDIDSTWLEHWGDFINISMSMKED